MSKHSDSGDVGCLVLILGALGLSYLADALGMHVGAAQIIGFLVVMFILFYFIP